MIPFSRGRGFAQVWVEGCTESGTLCKIDGCSVLAGGEGQRGQRCPGEPERAGAHRQVLGVQLCALYQNLWRGTGEGVIFHCPLRSWLNVLLLTDQIQEYAVGLETGTEIIANDFKL